MDKPEFWARRNAGYKLYNGCPNRALQEKWDEDDRLRASLPEGVFVTWFPVEQAYMACDRNKGYKIVSDFGSLAQVVAQVLAREEADHEV